MFSRFNGISHREVAIRHEQAKKASGLPSSLGGSKGSSLEQTFTRPLCLCKLQREADAKKAAGRY